MNEYVENDTFNCKHFMQKLSPFDSLIKEQSDLNRAVMKLSLIFLFYMTILGIKSQMGIV